MKSVIKHTKNSLFDRGNNTNRLIFIGFGWHNVKKGDAKEDLGHATLNTSCAMQVLKKAGNMRRG